MTEFRAVYDEDRYEVMCENCGQRAFIIDRRYPKQERLDFVLRVICICGEIHE